MFNSISTKLVCAAVDRNIVALQNREEVIYGLNAFLTLTINVASAIIVGALMHMLPQIILFIAGYKSLRKYVGGSHAKNARQCYITSIVTYIIALLLIRCNLFGQTSITIMVCICSGVMFAICPVEAEKKPLDDLEKVVFRRRSRITISIFMILFLILHYSTAVYLNYTSNIIATSIIIVAIFAVQGNLQNRKRLSE